MQPWSCDATFCVVLVISLPGKHSPVKLAERRDRARRRGFLLPRLAGQEYISVCSNIARSARASAKSLRLLARHNEIAGWNFHFAAHAAIAAHDEISDSEFKLAMKTHKARNHEVHFSANSRATKHGGRVAWADWVEVAEGHSYQKDE